VIFEAEVAGTEEIKRWILTWGAQAEVLSPKSLREELRREAEALARNYRQRSSEKIRSTKPEIRNKSE
jgi:predicted DNA-binding transcriptional regulator YafY